jgi:hypothetical protein
MQTFGVKLGQAVRVDSFQGSEMKKRSSRRSFFAMVEGNEGG